MENILVNYVSKCKNKDEESDENELIKDLSSVNKQIGDPSKWFSNQQSLKMILKLIECDQTKRMSLSWFFITMIKYQNFLFNSVNGRSPLFCGEIEIFRNIPNFEPYCYFDIHSTKMGKHHFKDHKIHNLPNDHDISQRYTEFISNDGLISLLNEVKPCVAVTGSCLYYSAFGGNIEDYKKSDIDCFFYGSSDGSDDICTKFTNFCINYFYKRLMTETKCFYDLECDISKMTFTPIRYIDHSIKNKDLPRTIQIFTNFSYPNLDYIPRNFHFDCVSGFMIGGKMFISGRMYTCLKTRINSFVNISMQDYGTNVPQSVYDEIIDNCKSKYEDRGMIFEV